MHIMKIKLAIRIQLYEEFIIRGNTKILRNINFKDDMLLEFVNLISEKRRYGYEPIIIKRWISKSIV